MKRKLLLVIFALTFMDAYRPGALAKDPLLPKTAVLPIKMEGGEAALVEMIEKAANDEIGNIGVFRLLPKKTVKKKLATMKKKKILDDNCHNLPRCIKAVGNQLGARVLFYLEVKSTADTMSITAQTYDVRSGKMIRSANESCGAGGDELTRATSWAIRMASGPVITTTLKGKGKLKVNSTVQDAEIILNGKSFGQRVGKIFAVSSGAFDVMVRKEGYQPFRDVVIVKPNITHQVDAALKATEKPIAAIASPAEEKPAEPPPPKKEEKPELPAWAIFETPKKTEPLAPPPPPTKESPLMALPLKETPSPLVEEKTGEEEEEEDRPFWKTWWFWTIIGTAVAAGAGTTTYFLLSSGGTEKPAGVGSAVIHWE